MTQKELEALLVELKMEPAAAAAKAGAVFAATTAAAQELETSRQQLAEANERLNAEMAEWATLTQREKAEATELRQSLEASRVRTTQLESRITAIAKEAGMDPAKVLEGTVVVPDRKPDPPTPAIDTSRLVNTEQFGNFAQYAIDLPADLAYIQAEHQALTGERIDTREIVKIVKENAKKNGVINPVTIWEQKYGIADKRKAKADADQAKLIADAEARGEERGRSAQALPNATPTGRHSPVFGSRNDQGQFVPRTSALNRPQPGSTVAAAAAAIRSGKYRQKIA